MSKADKTLLTRREVIKYGLLGAAALAAGGPLNLYADPPPLLKLNAKAKSVIQIWMWGGPSHLDSFDPKPDAGYNFCGPYNSPIKTNVDDIRICEMLPLLAKQADKYSIIRSMTHGINAHETASYMTQTGHEPGRLVYPCVGAVVSMLKGYKYGYKGVVPPYIVLTQPQGRFSEAGFFGPEYKPFATGGDPNKDPFMVEGIVAEGITDERQHSRRALLHSLDTLGKAMPEEKNFKDLNQAEDKAYEMMFGDVRELFNLSSESDETRDLYGRNTFGQGCLTARRLVEHGVPYVTINYKGWDTHKQHFQIMGRKLPEMDRAMATLLKDLSERGLLDSTIVWWQGEFGRGPKIQWNPPWNGGRSHHGACFSAMVAGGGFKGGSIIGSSDRTGSEVETRPVYPQNMIGTIYHLLGINPNELLPNSRGLDVKIMPQAEEGDGLLTEII